ncbi:MAG: NADH-quinone oxidoreductase subunit NuoH [Holophagales bacterium]|jgi:NADH-quinone oxidoreductase subunit H|nr:NADH-quinone oxidoreductase subunit NuoH [Holophagales bacterium]
MSDSFTFLGMDLIPTVWMLVKILAVFAGVMSLAAVLTWAERKGAALIQDRIGPNRAKIIGNIRLFGIFHLMGDGLKLIFKEDLVPRHVTQSLFWIAPLLAFVPAMMGFAIIPFGQSFEWSGYTLHMSVIDPGNGMGMLYPMAIASLAVYGILTASWASNNKWSMLSGMRGTANMISYEISFSLAVIAVFLQVGAYDPHEIIAAQSGIWNVVRQPLGFLLFFICAFAETNRLPFDFAEGESEIVAGFLTEFSGMKLGLLWLSEYVHMVTVSALMVTLYFGGWQVPFVADPGPLLSFIAFAAKLLFFCWLFIWVRWTLPRFRYDQLMSIGWKVLLPVGFANLLFYAWLIHQGIA